VIFRPVERSDLDRLNPLLVPDPASALIADGFLVRFEAGEYRPAWTWIAEESPDAELAAGARAAAGARTGAGAPAAAADDRVALATDLLTAAHQAYADAGLDRPPDFHILLPPYWRDRQDVTAALNWRLEAARRAGLISMLERIRYEWTPAAGVPEPSGRG
jgi:hypothetical protein